MSGAPASITVRLPQALADHAHGQRQLVVDSGQDVRLRDVLTAVQALAPAVGRRVQDDTGAVRRFVNVYVGDDECRALQGLDTPVPPGTTVSIIPSVAGG